MVGKALVNVRCGVSFGGEPDFVGVVAETGSGDAEVTATVFEKDIWTGVWAGRICVGDVLGTL